jgi:hypothetical protein
METDRFSGVKLMSFQTQVKRIAALQHYAMSGVVAELSWRASSAGPSGYGRGAAGRVAGTEAAYPQAAQVIRPRLSRAASMA